MTAMRDELSSHRAEGVETPSGKWRGSENFPVGSFLIRRDLRVHVHAFYRFARNADDVADNPALTADDKIARLDRMAAILDGASGLDSPAAAVMRQSLLETGMTAQHCHDVLHAFRLDAVKLRYRDWDDLMSYCSLSAMPVGRFVCDVHGESRSVWPANDALCAALQIINHLQDCKDDYRNLDRVYIPQDALATSGVTVEALGAPRASPALLVCLHRLAERTERLLGESDAFGVLINDWHLGLEVSVINTLAHRLTRMLMTRDPLSERVHLSMPAVGALTLCGALTGASRRLGRRLAAASQKPRGA